MLRMPSYVLGGDSGPYLTWINVKYLGWCAKLPMTSSPCEPWFPLRNSSSLDKNEFSLLFICSLTICRFMIRSVWTHYEWTLWKEIEDSFETWLSLITASSMLSILRENMGLLCSRNRHYNEADAEENIQVSNSWYLFGVCFQWLHKIAFSLLFFSQNTIFYW